MDRRLTAPPVPILLITTENSKYTLRYGFSSMSLHYKCRVPFRSKELEDRGPGAISQKR